MKNLITRLFSRREAQIKTQKPELPEGQRLYCIGDIHGRYDLLQEIHTIILKDSQDYLHPVTVVYMGDYIDRGAQSKEVIDYLLSNPLPLFQSVFLMGNHEQILLEFLFSPNCPRTVMWLGFGGLSTLASYGVQVLGIPHAGVIKKIRQQFKQKIPDSHVRFFQQMKAFYEKGGYYFAHAGVRPKVRLSRQKREDLLWIREGFLESKLFHGKVIVHGHSVTDEPVIRDNRIGIDTGAYDSGLLTCLVLEGKEQRFFSTKAKDKDMKGCD
ncbi:MAG: serine/threonine protein phosphatase [Methylococcales bacterium]|nr:serine/threonine protein phosphatase [Methylococcales bacterium]